MANPTRDYFSARHDGLLQAFAELHPSRADAGVSPGGSTPVTVDGRVHHVASAVRVELRSDRPLMPVAGRTWWVAYEYALNPRVTAVCDTGAGVRHPSDLLSRERPWPWTFSAHQPWAVGFQEVPVPATGLDAALLTWRLYVAPTGAPSAASDFQLRNFRLYSVSAFDLTARIHRVSPTTDVDPWPTPDWGLVPAWTRSVSLPVYAGALSTAAEYATSVDLVARDRSAHISFQGTLHPARLDAGRDVWTSAFVFPAAGDAVALSAAEATLALIQYLALLDAYNLPLTTLLSLERAVFLDATAVLGVPANPPPAPAVPRAHRFAARLKPAEPNVTPLLGGESRLDMPRHYRMAQELGQSAAFVDITGDSLAASLPEMLRFGLSLIHVTHDWRRRFHLASDGTIRTVNDEDLTKNPLQLDMLAVQASANAFTGTFPGLDRLIDSGGELVVHTPELGDTNMGEAFTLRRSLTDIDQVNLDNDGEGYRMILESGEQSALLNLQLEPDQQYQAGFRWYLIERYHEMRLRAAAAVGAPPSLAAIRDDVGLNRDVLTRFMQLVAGDPDDPNHPVDVALFDPLLQATNGTLDSFPWNRGGFAITTIEDRCPTPASPSLDRAAWYCAMRYWNVANIAYLDVAVSGTARALGRLPLVHTTNTSKPLGYWFGFEHYHAVRSGALDVIWLHDQCSRFQQNDGNQFHLLFSNVLADFARACAHLSGPTDTYRRLPRRIGVYLASDRVDIKALIWASRGATLFELYAACDAYLFPGDNGVYNTGDVSLQFLRQSQRAAKFLQLAQDGLAGLVRPRAVVAIVVPQSDGVWESANSDKRPDGKSKDGLHGFVHGYVLNASTHGVHAMFTQRHLAVDFVFEEEIIDAPGRLDRYQVLVSTAKLLRDDVFLAIGEWVERRAGVFVCCAGSHYVNADSVTVGGCYNEFYELRPGRLDWLGVTSTTPPDELRVKTCGDGMVVLPQETVDGVSSAATLIGAQYVYSLGMRYGFFVNPDRPYGAQRCEAFMTTVEDCVGRVSGGLRTLMEQRHCWVTRNDGTGTAEPFIEAILLVEPGARPRRGAIVLIDHRQRRYQAPPGGDERATPIAEAERLAIDVTVHVSPAILTLASARRADGTLLTSTPGSFDLAFWDYEIIALTGP